MSPPITHDNVFYCCDASSESGFYVEVTTDTNKRHCHLRAPPFRLRTLLTEQSGQTKDEPDHFYSAQLVHYGLKPLKTKLAAKRNLLSALDSGTLVVPAHIELLRKDLQVEYARLHADAMQMYAQENEASSVAPGVRPKQTARRTGGPLKLADISARANGLSWSLTQDDEPKPIARGAKPIARGATGKQTARRGGTSMTFTDRISGSGSKVGASGPSTGGITKNTKGSSVKLTGNDTRGQFNIVCPYISEQWSYQASGGLSLTMCPSEKTQQHLWVSFDLGVVEGVMRGGPAPATKNSTWHFLWRGSETGEGEQTFGSRNTGTITFLGNGSIKGTITGSFLGDNCQFSGTHVETPNVFWHKSVRHWKETWRGINDASYEGARVGRWGKWVSDEGRGQGPAESDSSANDIESDEEGYRYDVDVDMAY